MHTFAITLDGEERKAGRTLAEPLLLYLTALHESAGDFAAVTRASAELVAHCLARAGSPTTGEQVLQSAPADDIDEAATTIVRDAMSRLGRGGKEAPAGETPSP